VALLGNARQPGLRGAFLAERLLLAAQRETPVGARPDTDIILVAPVDEVVA